MTDWLKRGFLVLGLVILPLVGGMRAVEAQTSQLTLERLYSLPSLIGTAPRAVSWSPDGQRLLFLWNDEGRNFRDVWTLGDDLQHPRRATHLASPSAAERDRGVSWAGWSADSRTLIYLFRSNLFGVTEGQTRQLTHEGGFSMVAVHPLLPAVAARRRGDLWWIPLEPGTGKQRRLTLQSGEARGVSSFRWSPDGRRMAVLVGDRSDVRERHMPDYLQEETGVVTVRRPYPGEATEVRRLGIVEMDSGAWRSVSLPGDLMEPIWSYRFSPDSRSLLVDKSDFFVKDRRLLVYPPGKTRPELWYREQDPKNVTPNWRAEWAPRGGVYFLSDRTGSYQIHHLDRAGGKPRQVTHGEGEVASFFPAPDGKSVLFVANFDAPEQRHLFRVSSAGGQSVRLSHRPGTHAPVLAPDFSRAAVLFSSDTTPPDLFLSSLDAQSQFERHLTTSPLEEFGRYRWVEPRYVQFSSHVDGVELNGRLTLPPDFDPSKKYPAILGSVYADSVRNQWGGRTAHPTWGLDQLLVQQGYVLLNVNVRGSWGHGRDFRQGLYQDYGGIDIEDLHSGVKYLVAQGFADPERIGLWGSSYGGLMTCMSLFKKPGVYRAGIAGAPATNVWHAFPEQMWVMMQPSKFPDKFRKSSAFHQASGLQDSLMIIHGMRDAVVFYQDTLRLVDRLISEGKDVDLVTLPNAGHGWDNEGLAQTRFAFRKMLEFFERHLAP